MIIYTKNKFLLKKKLLKYQKSIVIIKITIKKIFQSKVFFNYIIIFIELFNLIIIFQYIVFIIKLLIYLLFINSKKVFFSQFLTYISILYKIIYQIYLNKRFISNSKYIFSIFLLFLIYKNRQILNINNLFFLFS